MDYFVRILKDLPNWLSYHLHKTLVTIDLVLLMVLTFNQTKFIFLRSFWGTKFNPQTRTFSVKKYVLKKPYFA
jgi:hypothetical protein